MCFGNVTTNNGGIPLFVSTTTTVGTESIDIAMGFRRIQPIGYFTLRISDVVPEDATTTLPITLTLNGTTRNLTVPNGTQVTAAELINTSVITVWNDRFNGSLMLMSRTVA
jgi:hypothetical protein